MSVDRYIAIKGPYSYLHTVTKARIMIASAVA